MHETLDDTVGDIVSAEVGRLLDDLRDVMRVDTAAVLLLDGSGQYLVASAARGIEEEVRQGSRVPVGQGFAGRVAALREPVVLKKVSEHNVVNPLLVRHGIASMLGVPLLRENASGSSVLGVLHVGSLVPRVFDDADVRTAEAAAQAVAATLVRQRDVANRIAAAALQQSLTPRLPRIDGLDLGARYVPGSRYGVGGDWYDVFELRPHLVGVTIGDVTGHGLHAATVMGRVRSALRAYALEHDDPATVLDLLDRKMRHFEPGLIGTVCYGVLDLATGRLTVSSAGHLPPALVPAPGARAGLLDVPPDTPIGVPPVADRRATGFDIPPGAVLCFYTDGLVERRTMDLDQNLTDLCRTVERATFIGSSEFACAEIMSEMLGDRDAADDVSLLIVARSSAS